MGPSARPGMTFCYGRAAGGVGGWQGRGGRTMVPALPRRCRCLGGGDMSDVAVPALAGHRFLRDMPAPYLAFLAEASSLVTVPAGHRFFEAGGVAKRFWLIRAGQIAVDMRVPGDGRAIIETLGRGDMLGVS